MLLKKIAYNFIPLGRRFFRALREPYMRESTDNIYDAIDFVRKTYLDHINSLLVEGARQRLKNGGKLRIGFVVNEGAKWNCSSLLDELQKEQQVETRIYLSVLRKDSYLKEREFFLGIDNKLQDLYDWENDVETPIEDLDLDVAFYQQPWGMRDYPRRMAGRTLNAYMHYSFMIMANHGMHYNIGSFHSYLWRYFTQTERHRLLHLEHDPSAYDRAVVVGYPKLDVYLTNKLEDCDVWKDYGKRHQGTKRIIFAPHHSFGKGSLQMATFKWSGRRMLEFAKRNPNFQWVYKPHPRLKYSVVGSRIMTNGQYQAYEQAWANSANSAMYDQGNYFDIFKTSDVLITDCCSFLAEYLPTGKPIIRLISRNAIDFNAVGRRLAGCYYEARNMKEFESLFHSVVVQGNDPLKGKRLEAVDSLFPMTGKSSTAIVQHLKSCFDL